MVFDLAAFANMNFFPTRETQTPHCGEPIRGARRSGANAHPRLDLFFLHDSPTPKTFGERHQVPPSLSSIIKFAPPVSQSNNLHLA